MNRFLPLLVLLGCSARPSDTPMMPPPGALDIYTLGLLPPGAVAEIVVENAVPGVPVRLVGGLGGLGSGPCPAVLGGLCVDIRGPVRSLNTLNANSRGVVRFYVPVPGDIAFDRAWVQAFQVQGSILSSSATALLEIPELSDSDNDGLSYADEFLHQTNPNLPDTDGDGYRDGDEVNEGSDPLDPTSLIYTGGWPYNPYKDALVGPAWVDGAGVSGARLPRDVWLDEYGEGVDLYDLAGHGKPVVIVGSSLWSAPDLDYAGWIAGAPGIYATLFGPEVPDLVAAGDILWVVAVAEAAVGVPAAPADLAAYRSATGLPPQVPILAMPSRELQRWSGTASMPEPHLFNSSLDLILTHDVIGVTNLLEAYPL